MPSRFINTLMKKIVTPQLLEELSRKAQASPRLRLNHNFHDDLADPINRLLNAIEPGSYVQPHKHPDKREVFIVLKGSLVVVLFDSDGNPEEYVLLNQFNGNHAVEIPIETWHTIFALETGSVVFEVKDGPYIPISDKNFASWAPKEGDSDCIEYLEKLTAHYYTR